MLKDEWAPYVLNDCKNYNFSLVSTTCIITYIKDPLICIYILHLDYDNGPTIAFMLPQAGSLVVVA